MSLPEKQPAQVLVVGAGPTGLLVALALAQNGIPLHIIDKETGPHVGQRGAGIQPRTLEMYNLLGVLPDFLQAVGPLLPLRSYKLPGGTEPLKTWNMREHVEPSVPVPYPNPVVLGQDRAELLLIRHLEKYGVHVERGTVLSSFEQDSESVSALVTRPATSGDAASETITVKYLVGADGARGVTRKQLGLSFLGETYNKDRFVIGDLQINGLDRDLWHMWGEPKDVLISLRPSERKDENLFMLIAIGQNVPFESATTNHAAVIDFVKTAIGRVDLDVEKVVTMADYWPNVRMVNKFGEGRVFVAGDQAHVHSPTGGQGLNSGVLDAMNLSWKLALSCKSLAHPDLLSTYTSERLPVIAQMLNLSTALLTRTVAGRVADTEPWTRSEELSQLGVNYRWSAIVREEGETGAGARVDAYGLSAQGGRLRAGDRAPDASGLVDAHGDTMAFFAQFSALHHTALIFAGKDAGAATGLLDALRAYPGGLIRTVVITRSSELAALGPLKGADVVVEDKEGHAFKGYGMPVDAVSVVIVRPDGFIGAIVRSAARIQSYFSGILKV